MAEFPVPLDNLIAYVKALHPDGGPLENVADAFAVSARLDEQSDALIGYFVDQARRSGASWSQIGAAMGVTKQAAQKRFVPGRDSDLITLHRNQFSRFTPRAANVLAAAGRLVAGRPADATEPAIGAAQLTAALLTEPEGIAALVIQAAGLTPEQVYAAVGAGPAEPFSDADTEDLVELGFDESGKAALQGTLKAALRLGHNYIGTEHLLFGVLDTTGPAARALAALGLTRASAEQSVAAELERLKARLKAR
jgi:hypothetical protein